MAFAKALDRGGRLDEAEQAYEKALKLRPDWHAAANDLAWLLATADHPGVRQPERSLSLAEWANEQTEGRQAAYLDTLAAAQAAAGRLESARRTARGALRLAETEGQTTLAAAIAASLARYNAGQPFVRQGRHVDRLVEVGRQKRRHGDITGAVECYTEALRLRPGASQVANDLAWLLAAYRSPVFHPQAALDLAHQVCRADQLRHAAYLDTLAVALAAAECWEEAVEICDQALARAEGDQQPELAAELRGRREMFLRREPFVAPLEAHAPQPP